MAEKKTEYRGEQRVVWATDNKTNLLAGDPVEYDGDALPHLLEGGWEIESFVQAPNGVYFVLRRKR